MTLSSIKNKASVVPNALTALRFLGAIFLLFFEVGSFDFWVIYFACGLSDMLDGYLARKLKCESKTGALLDSLADIVFVVCCCYKLIPAIAFPNWLWLWGGAIATIKVITQISALALYKKCRFLHTIANKVTGFLLFVGVPLTLFMNSTVPIIIIGIIATFAAIQETFFVVCCNYSAFSATNEANDES